MIPDYPKPTLTVEAEVGRNLGVEWAAKKNLSTQLLLLKEKVWGD